MDDMKKAREAKRNGGRERPAISVTAKRPASSEGIGEKEYEDLQDVPISDALDEMKDKGRSTSGVSWDSFRIT